MKAMILAAGLGQRMRPLTDHLPKPLLRLADKPLLQYHLEALGKAGISEIIINLAYLGHKIRDYLGDGSRFGLQVRYSEEPEPLETGGAILKALPLLGDEPFLLINGDVWTDFDFRRLSQHQLPSEVDAHLVLVPNPEFHPNGDFSLDDKGLLVDDPVLPRHTFAGISLIHPRLIRDYPQQRAKFPLVEALRYAIARERISGSIYKGRWSDIGTPERLQRLDNELRKPPAATTR
jgi:N-acetyl-alpha-D-muramate 1-phosphate uridylyltransferase